MARYTDAVCKLCRREGQKLFLKVKDATQINAQLRAEHMPPVSMVRDAKTSEYGLQLRAKANDKTLLWRAGIPVQGLL